MTRNQQLYAGQMANKFIVSSPWANTENFTVPLEEHRFYGIFCFLIRFHQLSFCKY